MALDPITIPWWRVPLVLSIILNFLLLFLRVRRRVRLEEFVIGVWRGQLQPHPTDRDLRKTQIIDCTLLVAPQHGRSNAGYMYYVRRDVLENNQVIMFGLDQLSEYETDLWFFCRRTWEPMFTRCFHKTVGEGENYEDVHFKYQCRVTRLWFRAKMELVTKLENGDMWKGTLERD